MADETVSRNIFPDDETVLVSGVEVTLTVRAQAFKTTFGVVHVVDAANVAVLGQSGIGVLNGAGHCVSIYVYY